MDNHGRATPWQDAGAAACRKKTRPSNSCPARPPTSPRSSRQTSVPEVRRAIHQNIHRANRDARLHILWIAAIRYSAETPPPLLPFRRSHRHLAVAFRLRLPISAPATSRALAAQTQRHSRPKRFLLFLLPPPPVTSGHRPRQFFLVAQSRQLNTLLPNPFIPPSLNKSKESRAPFVSDASTMTSLLQTVAEEHAISKPHATMWSISLPPSGLPAAWTKNLRLSFY